LFNFTGFAELRVHNQIVRRPIVQQILILAAPQINHQVIILHFDDVVGFIARQNAHLDWMHLQFKLPTDDFVLPYRIVAEIAELCIYFQFSIVLYLQALEWVKIRPYLFNQFLLPLMNSNQHAFSEICHSFLHVQIKHFKIFSV